MLASICSVGPRHDHTAVEQMQRICEVSQPSRRLLNDENGGCRVPQASSSGRYHLGEWARDRRWLVDQKDETAK